jgi:methionine sulfoxide reductase heme-binding subunit
MSTEVLHRGVLNGWPLFTLISALTAFAIFVGLSAIGVETPQDNLEMIRLSVQLASPWIFFAFVASPLLQLFRNDIAKWFVRNRRYLGLAFAAGFGWQLVFIFVLFACHSDYYWQEIHKDSELFIRVVSYVLLFALTITSFQPWRRMMGQKYWYRLHLLGVWYFWAAIWVSYTDMVISHSATVIAFVYFILGLLVLAIRMTAFANRLNK